MSKKWRLPLGVLNITILTFTAFSNVFPYRAVSLEEIIYRHCFPILLYIIPLQRSKISKWINIEYDTLHLLPHPPSSY